jgi:Asp-tRNA(Asn)/Glu-tRNA(Gln) amidotransferase A subunit family amidase
VKAVIETNPDALDIADELDEERKHGHIRTRLHGIPFILKDNIATKDKMQTTAGCAALVGTGRSVANALLRSSHYSVRGFTRDANSEEARKRRSGN